MSQKVISNKKEVETFLSELKEIFMNPNFDLNKDFDILLKKTGELPTDPYTTQNTILALDFDRHDIVRHIMKLNIAEYIETFIDDKDAELPLFYAFGKIIKKRNVYIKLKIRDKSNCKIFCVSFHFARFPLQSPFPYEEFLRGVNNDE